MKYVTLLVAAFTSNCLFRAVRGGTYEETGEYGHADYLRDAMEHEAIVTDIKFGDSTHPFAMWSNHLTSKLTPYDLEERHELLGQYATDLVSLFVPFINERMRATNDQIGVFEVALALAKATVNNDASLIGRDINFDLKTDTVTSSAGNARTAQGFNSKFIIAPDNPSVRGFVASDQFTEALTLPFSACNADTGAVVTLNYDFPPAMHDAIFAGIEASKPPTKHLNCESDVIVKFTVGPLKGLCDPQTDANAQDISLEDAQLKKLSHGIDMITSIKGDRSFQLTGFVRQETFVQCNRLRNKNVNRVILHLDIHNYLPSLARMTLYKPTLIAAVHQDERVARYNNACLEKLEWEDLFVKYGSCEFPDFEYKIGVHDICNPHHCDFDEIDHHDTGGHPNKCERMCHAAKHDVCSEIKLQLKQKLSNHFLERTYNEWINQDLPYCTNGLRTPPAW